MGKHKPSSTTPKAPKADELQLYRANLINPLLQELVTANRLGTLLEAREQQDQVKFSGLYKLESYIKDLKEAINTIPTFPITASAGDIIAGVQIHQSSQSITTTISPPSQIDICGSYLHGTILNSSYNVDLNITLPENYFIEKDFQNYGYFDKRALYVAAIAFHLRHYDSLRFSNLYITHEPHDPLKPIIIIYPSQPVDNNDITQKAIKNKNNDNNIELLTPSGLLGKFKIILHFVPPINSIAMRKLAPNRNNVKTIEQQRWIDFAINQQTNSLHKMIDTPLSETILINNIAPTPDYNHIILQDLLSTSQTFTYATLLGESKLMQSLVIIAKIWFKLRGLYIDSIPTERTHSMVEQCANINAIHVTQYQQLLSQLTNNASQQQQQTKSTKQSTTNSNNNNNISTQLLQLLQSTPIHYSYRHHFSQHSLGLTGTQITHIIIHLFITRAITPHNNLQHGMDAFFRFFLLHYPDNKDAPSAHTFLPNQLTILNPNHETNIIATSLLLPPDYDNGITTSILQTTQEDYKTLYQTHTPQTLFHAFDVVMLDCNGIFNLLHNITLSTWYQIQAHALLSLKTTYGNNMGSLLSHDITPELLNANLSLILRHAQLGPLPDEDVFTAIYMTRLTHSKHTPYNSLIQNNNNTNSQHIDFDIYLQELHQLYLTQIEQLCQTSHFNDNLKITLPHQNENNKDNDNYDSTIIDEYLFYLQSHPQFNEDYSLLNYDGVYDVSLPINYIPYYPILNISLYLQRQHIKTMSQQNELSDTDLHQELLTKISFATLQQSIPLFFSSTTTTTPTTTTTKKQSTSSSKKPQYTIIKQLTTTYGTPQTQQQLQQDGDIVLYIPHPHLPTSPLYTNITQRITNILSHSLTNRVYSLYVEPRLTSTHTSFIWRVHVKLDPTESSRGLDKGPHAEQQIRCKEWRNWWGSNKSELRRFQDGSIMEVVVWNHSTSSYPLPNEQIPFIITQYILPLHLFSSTMNIDPFTIYSNRCVVTTPTHPLGIFLQSKTNQHLVDLYSDPDSTIIIPDQSTINPYQQNHTAIPKLVSTTCPIPNTLYHSYQSFSKLLKEMTELPLGVENIECTSAVLRGTTPFYPQQHHFDVSKPLTENDINHFFHQINNNTTTLGGDLQQQQQQQSNDDNHANPKHISNNNIYEPINVILTLGQSSKWPTDDLLAISRVKTAFYLKLGSIIRTQYSTGDLNKDTNKMSFDEAQQKVFNHYKNKKGNKKEKKDAIHAPGSAQAAMNSANNDNDMNSNEKQIGQVYAQVTPYYIDIYVQGYIYRCRIFNPTEISLFRNQTQSHSNIPPLVLGDGNFRTIEKEYLHRPQHAVMMRNLIDNFPILTNTVQIVYRWFQSHFITRNITIELTELLVSSVFLQSYPFTIPTSLPAALSRVMYRLSTFSFETKPLILPHFDFSMSLDAETKLNHLKFRKLNAAKNATTQQVSVICSNHQNQQSYFHQEYSTSINIDQFPTIYNLFTRRGYDNTRTMMYIVTPYDLESRAWTTRVSNHVNYQDHIDNLLSQLQTNKDEMDINTAERILHSLNLGNNSDMNDNNNDEDSDDNDTRMVQLHQQEQFQQDEMKNTYKNYYGSLIDLGEAPLITRNENHLITSLNIHDIIQLQSLTHAAFTSFTTLFHFTTNSTSLISIAPRQIFPQQRQLTFNKELWPIRSPIQWSFKHFLGLFKPNLQQFDAFILLSPNIFTTDQIKRSIWLYRSKGDNNNSGEEYIHFMARMTNTASTLRVQNNKNTNNHKNKNKSQEYKLPPDLVKKLKEQEESERLMALQANGDDNEHSVHNTTQFILYAGNDYFQSYLGELRATFGQYASFYADPNGGRVIAIKFHPFITKYQDQIPTLSQLQDKFIHHVIQRQLKLTNKATMSFNLNGNTTTPQNHIEHPLQPHLHLIGLQLAHKQQSLTDDLSDKAKTKLIKKGKLTLDLQKLIVQMAQLGQGIVQNVFIGFDDFAEHVYF